MRWDRGPRHRLRVGLRFPRSGPVAALWGGKGKLQLFGFRLCKFSPFSNRVFFPFLLSRERLGAVRWGILTGACVCVCWGRASPSLPLINPIPAYGGVRCVPNAGAGSERHPDPAVSIRRLSIRRFLNKIIHFATKSCGFGGFNLQKWDFQLGFSGSYHFTYKFPEIGSTKIAQEVFHFFTKVKNLTPKSGVHWESQVFRSCPGGAPPILRAFWRTRVHFGHLNR